jgi:hypothetical protein
VYLVRTHARGTGRQDLAIALVPVTGGYLLLRVRPSTSRLKHPWREDV